MDWLYEESSQCLASTLAQSYRAGSQNEWPLLFQRALRQSMLAEQSAKKQRWPWRIGRGSAAGGVSLDARADASGGALLPAGLDLAVLLRAIERLPPRRQEIFLLRAWEGMDEAEIAALLRCSESSVRSHYRRALQSLQTSWRQRSKKTL